MNPYGGSFGGRPFKKLRTGGPIGHGQPPKAGLDDVLIFGDSSSTTHDKLLEGRNITERDLEAVAAISDSLDRSSRIPVYMDPRNIEKLYTRVNDRQNAQELVSHLLNRLYNDDPMNPMDPFPTLEAMSGILPFIQLVSGGMQNPFLKSMDIIWTVDPDLLKTDGQIPDIVVATFGPGGPALTATTNRVSRVLQRPNLSYYKSVRAMYGADEVGTHDTQGHPFPELMRTFCALNVISEAQRAILNRGLELIAWGYIPSVHHSLESGYQSKEDVMRYIQQNAVQSFPLMNGGVEQLVMVMRANHAVTGQGSPAITHIVMTYQAAEAAGLDLNIEQKVGGISVICLKHNDLSSGADLQEPIDPLRLPMMSLSFIHMMANYSKDSANYTNGGDTVTVYPPSRDMVPVPLSLAACIRSSGVLSGSLSSGTLDALYSDYEAWVGNHRSRTLPGIYENHGFTSATLSEIIGKKMSTVGNSTASRILSRVLGISHSEHNYRVSVIDGTVLLHPAKTAENSARGLINYNGVLALVYDTRHVEEDEKDGASPQHVIDPRTAVQISRGTPNLPMKAVCTVDDGKFTWTDYDSADPRLGTFGGAALRVASANVVTDDLKHFEHMAAASGIGHDKFIMPCLKALVAVLRLTGTPTMDMSDLSMEDAVMRLTMSAKGSFTTPQAQATLYLEHMKITSAAQLKHAIEDSLDLDFPPPVNVLVNRYTVVMTHAAVGYVKDLSLKAIIGRWLTSTGSSSSTQENHLSTHIAFKMAVAPPQTKTVHQSIAWSEILAGDTNTMFDFSRDADIDAFREDPTGKARFVFCIPGWRAIQHVFYDITGSLRQLSTHDNKEVHEFYPEPLARHYVTSLNLAPGPGLVHRGHAESKLSLPSFAIMESYSIGDRFVPGSTHFDGARTSGFMQNTKRQADTGGAAPVTARGYGSTPKRQRVI